MSGPAEVMFGVGVLPPAPTPDPTPEHVMAERLFGGTTPPPPPKPAGRELSVAERLFGPDPQPADVADPTPAPEPPAEAIAQQAPSWAIPEGANVDAAVLEAFGVAVVENGVQPEAAQKLLDHVLPVMAERQAAMRASWRREAETVPEVVEALPAAREAMRAASAESRDWLNESGLGDHPRVIQLLAEVARGRR